VCRSFSSIGSAIRGRSPRMSVRAVAREKGRHREGEPFSTDRVPERLVRSKHGVAGALRIFLYQSNALLYDPGLFLYQGVTR
jgi:hypothetical protein